MVLQPEVSFDCAIAFFVIPVQNIAGRARAAKNHWPHPGQTLRTAQIGDSHRGRLRFIFARSQMPKDGFPAIFLGGGVKPDVKAEIGQIAAF